MFGPELVVCYYHLARGFRSTNIIFSYFRQGLFIRIQRFLSAVYPTNYQQQESANLHLNIYLFLFLFELMIFESCCGCRNKTCVRISKCLVVGCSCSGCSRLDLFIGSCLWCCLVLSEVFWLRHWFYDTSSSFSHFPRQDPGFFFLSFPVASSTIDPRFSQDSARSLKTLKVLSHLIKRQSIAYSSIHSFQKLEDPFGFFFFA